MIQHYFALQHTLIQRHMKEWGIRPSIGYPLFALVFVFLSYLFYIKVVFPAEAYSIFALFIISGLGTAKKKDFYKSFFGETTYTKIRLIENLICIIPFSIFLVVKLEWLYAALLLFISALLSRINYSITAGRSIPTPFSKSPFEFPVGFRKTFPIILLAYGLTGIGLKVGNFNLCAFSLGLIYFISLSYYFFIEQTEYVWIHSHKPNTFLFHKIKIASTNALLLSIPVLITLSILQFDHIWIILSVFLMGELFLITIILSKYTAYPREMNVPNGILVGLSLFFPPLLLMLIPFFYTRSVESLKNILA